MKYALKIRIGIGWYFQFYETNLTEKLEKWKLYSASYIIAFSFLQNIHTVVLFAYPLSQAIQETRLYVCLNFFQRKMCCWYLYFSVQKLFLIVFSSMGRCSLQYVWWLSISDIFWASTWLLIHVWVVNQPLCHFFSKIHTFIIHLE